MMYSLTLGLLLLGAAAPAQSLDDFTYADAAAVRKAWAAGEHTPPIDAVSEGGRQALAVSLPFAAQPNLGRSVIDRRVKLDLVTPGAFSVELTVDDAKAIGGVSLYFCSGKGWFSGSGAVRGSGRQTIRFAKSSFRTEDKPTSWQEIDGIRLAFWRGQAHDAQVRLLRLSSLTGDVALIVPGRGEGRPESKAAQEVAKRVTLMLEELGLPTDVLKDEGLTRNALGSRAVAVVGYCPQMPEAAVAELVRYVEGGGKLVLCYQLPAGLGKLLGFGPGKYVRESRPGAFAEMRFDAGALPGAPAIAKQHSWNITSATPADAAARIVGRWHDDQGQPTEHAALLVSPRGAFFSHIIMGEDPEQKKQLLAAVLGQLSPSLWRQMATQALETAGHVGRAESVDELAKVVAAAGNKAASERLRAGQAGLAVAGKKLAEKAFPQAIQAARTAHEQLAEAYLRAQSSPTSEGRAVWNHSGTGAYEGDWERSAAELERAGFNMVLPNMLWGGAAHYASDVLPRSATFERCGDQIEQCVAAAHRHKLEVHVWKVNWNLGSAAPKAFVEKLRSAGRTIVTVHGEPMDWLCPSHPENFRLELDSLLEVARKYAVDGLHFDYIRYPGPEGCYCDGCRERFEKESKKPVAKWPADCASGERKDEYRDWRCQQITRLVAAVRTETKKIRPGLKLSAAVFSAYPSCKEGVAQDWPQWVRAGYLDFICPMDYTESDAHFENLVENQLQLIEKRIPMYPGIGATASRVTLGADRVAGQVDLARRLGAAGFTVFNFQENTARTILPGLGLGVGARAATPPHSDKAGAKVK